MTADELLALAALPNFPDSAIDLIKIAGLKGAAGVITAFPGVSFPVPAVVGGGNAQGAKNWDRLVKAAGEAVAARIVRHWRGTEMYVPSCRSAQWSQAQDAIRARFDHLTQERGYSGNEAVFELALEYGVTDRAIQLVLKRPGNTPPAPTAPEQLRMF
ncbi:MAG: hypothetical protein LBQ81_09740 [Zoogloeaceae bacterium]|jgi:hypothetical protein|nr:hypothetical protein [Zoogloeaceae bacterium]